MVRERPRMSESEYAAKLEAKGLTEDASAVIPDPTPMAPPLGYIRQPSLTERIRDMVRSEHLRVAAESAGADTFDEADDFEVGEDYDPSSPYEEVFEPAPVNESTGVPSSPGGEEGKGLEGASEAGKPSPAKEGGPAAPPAVVPPSSSNSAST